MTTENRTTPEEEAFRALCVRDDLCAATRAVVAEACSIAYKAHLVKNHCCQKNEVDEAYEKMRLIAAGLSDRGLGQLADAGRAALAAGASFDPFDRDTPMGYRVYPDDVYNYYDTIFGMIASVYWRAIESKRSRPNPPDEPSDGPF